MKVYKDGKKIVIDCEHEFILSKNKYALEGYADNIEFRNVDIWCDITTANKETVMKAVCYFIDNGNYKLENGEVKSIF